MSSVSDLKRYRYFNGKICRAGKILFMAFDSNNNTLHLHIDRLDQIITVSPSYLDCGPSIGRYFVQYEGDERMSCELESDFTADFIPVVEEVIAKSQCNGRNCTAADGNNQHSAECIRDYELTCAGVSKAAQDVLAERHRQVEAEGYTPEMDDNYLTDDLAMAAACYAAYGDHTSKMPPQVPGGWPWARETFKPRDRRSNLVRAGALILAELERLDRDAAENQS